MKRIGIYLLAFTALLSSFSLLGQKLIANVASVDMTPSLELKASLGGYGDRMSRPAEGIHDRIWAKAIVLQKGDKKYAIVTIDVLALPPNVKPQLVKKLASEQWTEDNIMLLASHSHTSFDMTALNNKNNLNSPQIGIFQPKVLEHLLNTLSKAINEANQNLQPVSIGTGKATVEGMNRNRRGEPAVDKNLTVTRIDYKNGKPMALLVNWTAHPTFMSEDDMCFSGGWPGYLQRELQQWIGDDVTVMYYNGAEGDQSPIGKSVKSHYEKAELYGRAMAIKAYDIYKNIKTKPDVKFNYSFNRVELPERKVHPSFMETGGKEYNLTPEALNAVLNVMSPASTSIGAVRVGDLLIVGAPGELAAGLGLHIKDKLMSSGIKYPTIGGLANEWISYIISKEQYNNGAGYESSVSFYGDTLGEVIVKGMLDTSLPLTK